MMQDEIQVLQEENAALREENARLRALLAELLPLKTQVEHLRASIKQLESRLAKDSHNSHLPPSSDRFARQPKTKSLRQPSGKKPGAQAGHEGTTLYQVSKPDQVIVHAVEACAFCQHDLRQEPALYLERRQVLDIPPSGQCHLDKKKLTEAGALVVEGLMLGTLALEGGPGAFDDARTEAQAACGQQAGRLREFSQQATPQAGAFLCGLQRPCMGSGL